MAVGDFEHANDGGEPEDGCAKTVLIVDSDDPFRDNLARDFRRIGFQVWVARDALAAEAMLAQHGPSIIVCEDDLHRPWLEILQSVRRVKIGATVVVVTLYGSLSSAVRATRAGVSGYFAKPVSARQLLDFLRGDSEATPCDRQGTLAYRTLSRAHWEYINLTLDASGSIAEAARRLGIDRRSLRRMLNKYPPPL